MKNKKVVSNDDENKKVVSNDDEIDDYEDLYNIPKPTVKDEKPVINFKDEKPLSRRELSKSKPISSTAHNVFNKLMANQPNQPNQPNQYNQYVFTINREDERIKNK